MDFKTAVLTCLKDKYVDFKGRAGKAEFWWFFLFQIIVLVIAGVISDILYMLAALALLLPGLGVGARSRTRYVRPAATVHRPSRVDASRIDDEARRQ